MYSKLMTLIIFWTVSPHHEILGQPCLNKDHELCTHLYENSIESHQDLQQTCINLSFLGDACCQSRNCFCDDKNCTGLDINKCLNNTCGLTSHGCLDEYESDEFKCTCPQGKTGPDCLTVIEVCPANCIGGQCVDDKCQCIPGLTGEQCEQDIDDCATNTCVPPSICVDGVNSFRCIEPGHNKMTHIYWSPNLDYGETNARIIFEYIPALKFLRKDSEVLNRDRSNGASAIYDGRIVTDGGSGYIDGSLATRSDVEVVQVHGSGRFPLQHSMIPAVKRLYGCMVAVDNIFYSCFGWSDLNMNYINNCSKYEVTENGIKELPGIVFDPYYMRANPRCVLGWDNYIYVVAGRNGSGVLATVFRFREENNGSLTVQNVADLPKADYNVAVFYWDFAGGFMYACIYSKNCYMYKPDSWWSVNDYVEYTTNALLTLISDHRILYFGGTRETVRIRNPATREWEDYDVLPFKPVSGLQIDGGEYCIAGFEGDNCSLAAPQTCGMSFESSNITNSCTYCIRRGSTVEASALVNGEDVGVYPEGVNSYKLIVPTLEYCIMQCYQENDCDRVSFLVTQGICMKHKQNSTQPLFIQTGNPNHIIMEKINCPSDYLKSYI